MLHSPTIEELVRQLDAGELDDILDTLSTLIGKRRRALKARKTNAESISSYFNVVRSMTDDPKLLAAVDKAEKEDKKKECGCCGLPRVELPYTRSQTGTAYCQKCYDAGCSVDADGGGCVIA